MAVQAQDPRSDPPRWPPRFYAYCDRPGCGVCGPVRSTREAAEADDRAHDEVCSKVTAGARA